MELKDGIYDEVISNIISGEIKNINKDKILVQKENMDEEESFHVLSRYLMNPIEKALSYLNNDEKIKLQIELSNKIIELLYKQTGEDSLKEYIISDKGEMLLAVLNKLNSKYAFSGEKDIVRPLTPISQSSLFTGSKNEPNLESEFKKEILSSDSIDILVSFVKWSGIRQIADELSEFTEKHKLRIITTTYMGATDYTAVNFLSNLKNTEIKISYDTKRTRLHAKAYLFKRENGYSTAYIGSSNLSNAAISSGLEWNMKVTEKDMPDILKKFCATFESYWHDKEFCDYTIKDAPKFIRAINAEKNFENKNFDFDIQLYSYQNEIIDKLNAERKVHNRFRNLVVAATGTGKTVISAFDYKNFSKTNCESKCRLLFIAHRKEILEQSISCFRMVLHDQNFGDMLFGDNVPDNIDYLFMSIQSFNSKNFYKLTSPDFYDFIIIDEFHHAAAPTYQKILEYYNPKILLGLTATPERMDGKEILKYFGGKIAAEIRLPEAIDRKLLSPFQYFGVADSEDISGMKWSRGGYDKSELEKIYTGNTRRSQLIINAIKKYIGEIKNICGLGFCVGIEHAKYMAEYFNNHGIPSAALSSESEIGERNNVQKLLKQRKINFIFTVDLYNEGVDIPEVDTILFLRPTESLTVFLQQLGRGLRLCENKECLTVLDFIGQANVKYNFEVKYKALLDKTNHSVEKEIKNGFPDMPKGCSINLEKMSQKYILDNIKNSLNNKANIIRKISSFTEDTGEELNLNAFLNYYNIKPYDIYTKECFSRLCVEAKVKNEFYNFDEKDLAKAMIRIVNINSIKWIDFILYNLKNIWKIKEDKENMLLMFHYVVWQKSPKSMGFRNIKESFEKLYENKELYEEIIEILNMSREKIDFVDKKINIGFPCSLDLYCRYTRDEALTALGFYTYEKKPQMREGVLYIPEKNVDAFFVTLNKSEKDYSPTTLYDDYAIDEWLFHWQSQSTTSDTSKTGMRYINGISKVLIFVREYKNECSIASPYYYLGSAHYINHIGSRPMNITWKLDYPMPAALLNKANRLIIG